LAKLLRIHPDLQVGLVHDTPVRVTEDVVNFKVDFGIVPEPMRHPDLVIKRICSDEIRMWVGDGNHPTQDPQSGQAVLVYDPAVFWRFVDAKRKITFRRIITATNFALVARLVAAGAGIGILPNRVAVALGTAGMRPLSQDLTSLSHDICLIYRSDAQRSPAGRRLARDIEKTLREAIGSGAGLGSDLMASESERRQSSQHVNAQAVGQESVGVKAGGRFQHLQSGATEWNRLPAEVANL